jgi:hypothetical protein
VGRQHLGAANDQAVAGLFHHPRMGVGVGLLRGDLLRSTWELAIAWVRNRARSGRHRVHPSKHLARAQSDRPTSRPMFAD